MSAPPIDCILYDLDGTLLDSFGDIHAALSHALEACGLPGHSLETVKGFVGEGALRLVERALGPEAAHRRDEVVSILKTWYAEHPAETSRPYPGTLETLDALRARGLRQAILTNKPHAIALRSCDRTGLAERVDLVQGEGGAQPLKPHPEAALSVLRRLGSAPDRCLIVGDGEPDMLLARACAARSVGCAWGVTPRARLEELAGEGVLDSLGELPALLARLGVADRATTSSDSIRTMKGSEEPR